MANAPDRRFTLRVLMLRVALLGLGLGWVRASMDSFHVFMVGSFPERHPYAPEVWKHGIACTLVACTAALVGYRLRSPRPPLRRLARQPGMMACAAVAVALAIRLVRATRSELIDWWNSGHTAFPSPRRIGSVYSDVVRGISPWTMTFAIAGAWLALAASGRWRAERDGYDRLGRALGASWIVWAFWLAWT